MHFLGRNLTRQRLTKAAYPQQSHSFSQASSYSSMAVDLPCSPATAPDRYIIKAAVHHISVSMGTRKLRSFPWKVGHHFWILVKRCDGKDIIVDSIHGLSTRFKTGANGEQSPVISCPLKTWGSKLKVYSILPPSPTGAASLAQHWTEPDVTAEGYAGKDAMQRWNNAKRRLHELNDANIAYSFCGVGWSFGTYQCNNSNSAYTLIGRLLSVEPAPRFTGYAAPGLHTNLLPNIDLADQHGRY